MDSSMCPCRLCNEVPDHPEAQHHLMLRRLFPLLDERERRLFSGMEALRLGHGGARLISQVVGLSEQTVRHGRNELLKAKSSLPPGRVRRPGAGRPLTEKNFRN
jgi:hypothetical protein